MTFNTPVFFIEVVLILMISLLIVNFLFKSRKRSAEQIYKLIYDLEKKYIN